jgi:transposase
MPARRATTVQQRQEIARLVAAGLTYHTIAEQVGVSYWAVRKWARRALTRGVHGLVTRPGRPRTGALSRWAPVVRYVVLRLKVQHPTWGAEYVRQRLQAHPAVHGPVPNAVTIWRYWRQFGPRLGVKRAPPQPKRPRSGIAHGVWQLDFKEAVPVDGVGLVTITQARDEHSRVQVLHQVHPAPDSQATRVSVTTADVQRDCRIAFSTWGLPDAIQTDHAKVFVADEAPPFPTRLELWWVGLGIQPLRIPLHTPQRNGAVERSHRTLNERTLEGQAYADATALQQQMDADWTELNQVCPSRATGPAHLPPLRAHPEAAYPRRPYRPEWERDLFDLQRVYAHLATFTWLRPVSKVGQVNLGGYRYGVGMPWATQVVAIQFDPVAVAFVFTLVRPDRGTTDHERAVPCVRRPALGLTVADLTGLPEALDGLPDRQLALPLDLWGEQPLLRAA